MEGQERIAILSDSEIQASLSYMRLSQKTNVVGLVSAVPCGLRGE